MRHEEHIIDYIVDDSPNYEYCDNHGRLIRCRDCGHKRVSPNTNGKAKKFYCSKKNIDWYKGDDWYCADAIRKVRPSTRKPNPPQRLCTLWGGECKHDADEHCPNQHGSFDCEVYKCLLCKKECGLDDKEGISNE